MSLEQYVPRHYSNTIARKLDISAAIVSKVKRGKQFDSVIMLQLIELCLEEKARIDLLEQKIKSLENSNGKKPE